MTETSTVNSGADVYLDGTGMKEDYLWAFRNNISEYRYAFLLGPFDAHWIYVSEWETVSSL